MEENAGRLRIGDDHTGERDIGGIGDDQLIGKGRAHTHRRRPGLVDGDVTGRQAIVVGARRSWTRCAVFACQRPVAAATCVGTVLHRSNALPILGAGRRVRT